MSRSYIQDVKLYVHSSGNDANDGLSVSQPLQTLNAAISVLYDKVDCGGRQAEVVLQSDVTYSGSIYGQLVGTNFFKITGEGTQRRISAPTGASHIFSFGDGAQFGLANVELDITSTDATAVGVFGHQFGVIDLFDNVAIRGKAGDTDIFTDYGTQVNVKSGLRFRGLRSKVANIGPMSVLNFNGALISDNASCGGQLIQVAPQAYVVMHGNVSFSGDWFGSPRGYYVSPMGVLRNLSGVTIPGTNGYVELGGIYLTA